ncbi:Iron-sulfur assembly protein 1 [Hanseniaspora osmophila]
MSLNVPIMMRSYMRVLKTDGFIVSQPLMASTKPGWASVRYINMSYPARLRTNFDSRNTDPNDSSAVLHGLNNSSSSHNNSAHGTGASEHSTTGWSSYSLPSRETLKNLGKKATSKKSETSTATGTGLRKKRKLRPRKAFISLTPNAVVHLKNLLNSPDPKLIKIGVRNRGCSGLTYDLSYIQEPGKFDEVVEQDGVRVVIDSKALFSIVGCEMDWLDDKLSSRFVFKNPNSKGTCGCGESFHV